MDVLQIACYQAQIVLIQERREPTLTYRSDDPVRAIPFNGLSDVTQRNASYRRVSEATPPTLVSQNYGLLLVIFGKLDTGDRRRFLLWTIKQLLLQSAYDRRRSDILQAGRAATTTAESPLIAEFLIRQGAADLLVDALGSIPFTPSLTHLLLQLRNMLAYQFRLFTEVQLAMLGNASAAMCLRLASWRPPARARGESEMSNTDHWVRKEVPEIALAICEQCREAAFLYIKQSLVADVNTEVNQDKERVVDALKRLRFDDALLESLNEAEEIYRTATTGFELKSSMGHLRSFIENLHSAACQQANGSSTKLKWGAALQEQKAQGVLSLKEEQFVSAFYGLLSDEAVHPLEVARSHARLFRNITIEWGLLLLGKIESRQPNP